MTKPAGDARCPDCNAAIGVIYVRSGKSYLFDGIMMVRIGLRLCPVCGREYHWHGTTYDSQRQDHSEAAAVTDP